ncbi:MAG: selenium metabolism-associated LysR family transcriptional regulator [Nitrospirota bacterium]
MDVHCLRVFVSVFKNRSFTRASLELNLTQPTVSEHVRRLEEELETRLFDRMGRQVVPTAEAELLYERALEIIEKVRDIRAELGRFRGEVAGTLSVGASTIPGGYILPALMAGFGRKHPGVFFRVLIEDSRKITEMVLRGELLIGVVGARMSRTSIEYRAFLEDELVLAAAPGLLPKKEITPAELPGVPLLLREEGSGTRKSTEEHLAAKGLALKDLTVSAVLGSTNAVTQAVRAGLGASVLSRLAIEDDLREGKVERIRIKGLRMPRSFFVITHRSRSLPAQYRAFLAYLLSHGKPRPPRGRP